MAEQIKPKIAIYDFTDCEGCEVEIISLRENLLEIENRLDIVDWRLAQQRKEPFDSAQGKPLLAAIIEGTPITPDEIETLKYLRDNSTYLFSLGACASLAGIPGIVETRREKHWFLDNWNSNIYRSFRDLKGENYVKFPLVGIVGTLMETKVVTHSLTGGGEYIGGDEFQTTFYKILFRDRIPVWVDAPVWRCPEPLSLPIYLPIP